MKLIKPYWEIIEQGEGLEGLYKHIELCGRVSYKSEDKITEDSAEKFVKMLMDKGHYSVLEHGTLYLGFEHPSDKLPTFEQVSLRNRFFTDTYSKEVYYSCNNTEGWAFTTNFRRFLDKAPRNFIDNLENLLFNSKHHSKRVTVRFVCSRAIAQQLTRYRRFSVTMESTRYINYNNRDFTFVEPLYYNPEDKEGLSDYFRESMHTARSFYIAMINNGATPEQARDVLPLAIKTEVIMTGFIEDWMNVFNQRCSFLAKTGKPHPDISYLCDSLYQEFKDRGYIK